MGTEADLGFYARSTFNGPQVYTHTSSDNLVTGTWQKLYTGISRANVVLANINRPKMSDSARARIRGAALFLRAYYFPAREQLGRCACGAGARFVRHRQRCGQNAPPRKCMR